MLWKNFSYHAPPWMLKDTGFSENEALVSCISSESFAGTMTESLFLFWQWIFGLLLVVKAGGEKWRKASLDNGVAIRTPQVLCVRNKLFFVSKLPMWQIERETVSSRDSCVHCFQVDNSHDVNLVALLNVVQVFAGRTSCTSQNRWRWILLWQLVDQPFVGS